MFVGTLSDEDGTKAHSAISRLAILRTMADVILVHGAGTGGWLWDDVAMLLRAEGHRVSRTATLRGAIPWRTGLPPRIVTSHLSTHIDAVTELAGSRTA